MNALKSIPIVFFVAIVFFLSLTTNITHSQSRDIDLPWNLQQIDIKGAWEITMGSPDIVIAVIDTGIDFSHPALNHSQWFNTNEIINNSIDDDNNGYVDDYMGWD